LQKKTSLKIEYSAGEIKLVKEEAVDWPDTSLGYPEEGMMYAQYYSRIQNHIEGRRQVIRIP